MQAFEGSWGQLPPDAPLLPLSPSAFRRRWDFLLKSLAVPKSFGLTPGGLRGGGAVSQYIAGCHITDLMWRMRIRTQDTLAHYLQEATTLTSLAALPAQATASVSSAAALYPTVLRALSRGPIPPVKAPLPGGCYPGGMSIDRLPLWRGYRPGAAYGA